MITLDSKIFLLRKVTQQQIADALGVHKSTITLLLSGELKTEARLDQIADFLGISRKKLDALVSLRPRHDPFPHTSKEASMHATDFSPYVELSKSILQDAAPPSPFRFDSQPMVSTDKRLFLWQKKIKQKEIAAALGITNVAVSRLLSGSLKTNKRLNQIAAYLGIPRHHLDKLIRASAHFRASA